MLEEVLLGCKEEYIRTDLHMKLLRVRSVVETSGKRSNFSSVVDESWQSNNINITISL